MKPFSPHRDLTKTVINYQVQLNSFSDVEPRSFAGLRPVHVAQGSEAKLEQNKPDFQSWSSLKRKVKEKPAWLIC